MAKSNFSTSVAVFPNSALSPSSSPSLPLRGVVILLDLAVVPPVPSFRRDGWTECEARSGAAEVKGHDH